MENGKNNLTDSILFLTVAISGIAVFVSAWNSFLQGKGKIYISLAFLVLLLASLSALFIRYIRRIPKIPEVKSTSLNPETSQSQSSNFNKESGSSREPSINLLAGAFSKPDIKLTGEKILKNLAKEFEIVQGAFYFLNDETHKYTLVASYALNFDTTLKEFSAGEGITGQAMADAKIMAIPNIPDSYSSAFSGLGKGKARTLYIIPLVYEKKSLAGIEISCFKEIDESHLSLLNQLMREGGEKLKTLFLPESK